MQRQSILERECKKLGVPITEHKLEGPTTCLVYHSIKVDTVTLQLQLRKEKLLHLKPHLSEYGDHKACPRR